MRAPSRPIAKETIMKLRKFCVALAALAVVALAGCDPKPRPPKADLPSLAEVVAHVLH
jgi:hypothetical protein